MALFALRCPNCGSNVPRQSMKCEHCGAEIVLAQDGLSMLARNRNACPKCGSQIAERAFGFVQTVERSLQKMQSALSI